MSCYLSLLMQHLHENDFGSHIYSASRSVSGSLEKRPVPFLLCLNVEGSYLGSNISSH